jgi:hypothetical protein
MKKTLSVQSLKGIVRKPKVPVSIEDMNAARARSGAPVNGCEKSSENALPESETSHQQSGKIDRHTQ